MSVQFFGFETRERFLTFIEAAVPKWSALNTLGRSRAISLTVLVPFVGSFILFNDKISQYLTLMPQFSSGDSNASAWRLSLETRLYLLYFGLSLVGIASFLFRVKCPDRIKNYSNDNDFINVERNLLTVPRSSIIIREICSAFIESRFKAGGPGGLLGRISYPQYLRSVAYQTFLPIADEVSEQLEIDREGSSGSEEEEDTFYSYRGYMNLEYWVDTILSPPTAMRAVPDKFFEVSIKHPVDILTLCYMTVNSRNAYWRMSISLLYLFGFGLLIIPTLVTFGNILSLLLFGR